MSALEAWTNAAVGVAMSYTYTLFALPLFGVAVGAAQAAWISASFLVISTLRSYVLRRLFDRIS